MGAGESQPEINKAERREKDRIFPMYTYNTKELLNVLEAEFGYVVATIISMKDGKQFHDKARESLYQMIDETERRLQFFNKTKYPIAHPMPTPTSAHSQKQAQFERLMDKEKLERKIRDLQEENRDLKEKNSLLNNEKKLLDGLQEENRDLKKKNSLLNNEKKLLDGLLTNTMREKRVPHDSPASAPENKDVYDAKLQQKTHLQGANGKQDQSIVQLQRDLEAIGQENDVLRTTILSFQSHQKTLEQLLSDKDKRIKELSEDNSSLLLRLSKVAGRRLTEDNPAIADLSDANRPTKLGEMYSEIYDNEWTDAFEHLHLVGYTEEECINTLRLTLLNILQFCQRKSENLLVKTEEAVNILFEEFKDAQQKDFPKHLTMTRADACKWGRIIKRQMSFEEEKEYIVLQRKWKPKSPPETISPRQSQAQQSVMEMKPGSVETVKNQLKIFRKEVAESMVPLVQKAYIAASWNEKECITGLKPYIKKCLFLAWMMVVQSPPLALASCEEGDVFVKEIYKEYTKSGPKVQYVVWPALLLHAKGPVIGKGVAQGQQ